MKKIFYSFTIIISALFLCGFVAGVEVGDPDAVQLSEPTDPVVEYEETIAPSKTPQELYQQYHLLAVSSLEEAQSSFQNNKLWTYRMVHNASNYVKLLKGLVNDNQKSKYMDILDNLSPLLKALKNKNLTESKQRKLKTKLKRIAKTIDKDYSWEKVKTWIKQ